MGVLVLDERSSAFISGFSLKYKNLRMLRKPELNSDDSLKRRKLLQCSWSVAPFGS